MKAYVIKSRYRGGRKYYQVRRAMDATRPAAGSIPCDITPLLYKTVDAARAAALAFDHDGKVYESY